MTATAPTKPIRVAIYTRKSVTDGLEQEFNSLDAQRQAIEAYVQSQAGNGWTPLSTRYDDGGFSGSNTDRPGFQALLRDIERGHVDIVAVYKIDRLSRSLCDFAKLIDVFEQHGVTFVSVTQQFSTANSMGRLTLNILMSFAEFEREVISERIRDKVRATRRRGAWTGGRPILGYDVVDKKLAANENEAHQVRETFRIYLQRGSIRATLEELQRRGWGNKAFQTKGGKAAGGHPFSKGTLHALLTNILYTGRIRAGDNLVPGEHQPIVDAELWEAVQGQLRGNGREGGSAARNKTGALLRGMVRCGRCGSAMTHSFTTRKNRRHRYYLCAKAHAGGAAVCPGTRVPAGILEKLVVDQIGALGADSELQAKVVAVATEQTARQRVQLNEKARQLRRHLAQTNGEYAQTQQLEERVATIEYEVTPLDDPQGNRDQQASAALTEFGPVWDQLFPAEQGRILRLLVDRVTCDPDTQNVEVELRSCGIAALEQEATA